MDLLGLGIATLVVIVVTVVIALLFRSRRLANEKAGTNGAKPHNKNGKKWVGLMTEEGRVTIANLNNALRIEIVPNKDKTKFRLKIILSDNQSLYTIPVNSESMAEQQINEIVGEWSAV
jgi:hypothetical protein